MAALLHNTLDWRALACGDSALNKPTEYAEPRKVVFSFVMFSYDFPAKRPPRVLTEKSAARNQRAVLHVHVQRFRGFHEVLASLFNRLY